MAIITPRKQKDGTTRYRAQIRIRRANLPDFSESCTFSTKKLAETWGRKREAEIELDPSILEGKSSSKPQMTLGAAYTKYIDEVRDEFGISKINGLNLLSAWPIGNRPIDKLTRDDFTGHILARRKGDDKLGYGPIAASTALQELYYIRSVLKHADLVWNIPCEKSLFELDQAREGLSRSRQVSKSKNRFRLPTSEELQLLTTYFYQKWMRYNSTYPMHLVLWNAVYLVRRQAELTRIMLDDIDFKNQIMWVRDVKSPKGAEGNHKKARFTDISVPLIHDTIAARPKMLDGKPDDGRYLPLNSGTVGTYYAEACMILGIGELTYHDLRHEAATRLAEDGMTIPQIQQYSLHDSWASLQIYVDISPRGSRLDYEEAMRVARESLVH